MAEGPANGLWLLDRLAESGELEGYHLYHAARADFLRRLQQFTEAALAYRRALALTSNSQERAYLQRRLNEVSGKG